MGLTCRALMLPVVAGALLAAASPLTGPHAAPPFWLHTVSRSLPFAGLDETLPLTRIQPPASLPEPAVRQSGRNVPVKGMSYDVCQTDSDCMPDMTCQTLPKKSKSLDDLMPCPAKSSLCFCFREEPLLCKASTECPVREMCVKQASLPAICMSIVVADAEPNVFRHVDPPIPDTSASYGTNVYPCKKDTDCKGDRECIFKPGSLRLFLKCKANVRQGCFCRPKGDSKCRRHDQCDPGEVCAREGKKQDCWAADAVAAFGGVEPFDAKDNNKPPKETPPPEKSEKPSKSADASASASADASASASASADVTASAAASASPEPSASASPKPEKTKSAGAAGSGGASSSPSPSADSSAPPGEATPSASAGAAASAAAGAGASPGASSSPTPSSPAAEAAAEPVCVDARLLEHLPASQRVLAEDAWARVLCDAGGSCATAGHMVVFRGAAVMMRTYCAAAGCAARRMRVNSPRFARGLRVASRTNGLEFTAFAARFGTRAEEVLLRAAVRADDALLRAARRVGL